MSGTGTRQEAGGKGLNQAIAAARSGARALFVGAVGQDEHGRALADALALAGVETQLVSSAAPSGSATVVVAEDGENSIIVIPGANGDEDAIARACQDVIATVSPKDVLLAQLEIPIPVVRTVLSQAKARGATTILNAAPSSEVPSSVFEDVDVLVVNEHECLDLAGPSVTLERAAAQLAQSVRTVVVTLGPAGALVVHEGASRPIPGLTVAAVDTTAAGDTFCGAFAARLALTGDVLSAAGFGVAAAALSVQRRGASTSAPTLDATLALLASQ